MRDHCDNLAGQSNAFQDVNKIALTYVEYYPLELRIHDIDRSVAYPGGSLMATLTMIKAYRALSTDLELLFHQRLIVCTPVPQQNV